MCSCDAQTSAKASTMRRRRLTVVVQEGEEVTREGSDPRGDAAGRLRRAEGLLDADTDINRFHGGADETLPSANPRPNLDQSGISLDREDKGRQVKHREGNEREGDREEVCSESSMTGCSQRCSGWS
jgi:hypothetical protein